MKTALLLFLFHFVLAMASHAYPITPQTLRKEIENSTYIVLANVSNPAPPLKKIKWFDKELNDSVDAFFQRLDKDVFADLNITKVLKGNLKTETIRVEYPTSLSNPRPPRYKDKMVVIAFLKNSDSTNNYQTVGLSYGTLLFNTAESSILYQNLIQDYLIVSKIKNRKKRQVKKVEWLVKCCKERATRWHGAYELSRNRFWMSYYDNSADEGFSKLLTNQQKLTLENIVLACDTIDYNELALSDFVRTEKQEELKKILLFNLTYFRSYFAKDLMKRYLELHNNSELQKVHSAFKNLNTSNDENDTQAKILIARFIELAESE